MTRTSPVKVPRRGPWSDLRFVLGILLIVASVAGVWAVVASARQTVPVYAAARTIAAGSTITTGDLDIVEVSLGTARSAYLGAASLNAGSVATRTIIAGELVPTAAVGDAASLRTTSVVLRSTVDVAASVIEGAAVEVWAAPLRERGVYEAPRILVAGATVVRVTRDDSMLGGAAAALELTIPRTDVAAVLAAVAEDAAVSIVPTPGGAP